MPGLILRLPKLFQNNFTHQLQTVFFLRICLNPGSQISRFVNRRNLLGRTQSISLFQLFNRRIPVMSAAVSRTAVVLPNIISRFANSFSSNCVMVVSFCFHNETNIQLNI